MKPSCFDERMYCVFFFFFFSSRRRHTRLTCDWSSDVCSSDLAQLRRHPPTDQLRRPDQRQRLPRRRAGVPRRSEERRVGKSVDLGGRRITKKKNRGKERVSRGTQGRTTGVVSHTSRRCTCAGD